jgi:hypothetical protein
MEQPVRIRNLASVVAICAGSIAIAACGGGSSPTTTKPLVAKRPQQATTASNLDIGRAEAQQTKGGSRSKHSRQVEPTVSNGHKVQKGRPTPELSSDDHNPASAGAGQPNPCSLVSVAEAKTITGKEITRSLEAPLGPTCVYKLAGSKADITLDVESANLTQVTRHMAGRQQLTVHGHKAYCGKLGSEMLFVPLSGGRFLHVNAPCPAAQRLAALALTRLVP